MGLPYKKQLDLIIMFEIKDTLDLFLYAMFMCSFLMIIIMVMSQLLITSRKLKCSDQLRTKQEKELLEVRINLEKILQKLNEHRDNY